MALTELVAWVLALAVTVLGGIAMHSIFGVIGVVLLVAFSLPVAAFTVWWQNRSQGGNSGTATRNRRRSKGERGRE